MREFFLAEVATPDGDPGAILTAYTGAVEVQHDDWTVRFGHDDFERVPAAWLAECTDRSHREWFLVVALTGVPPRDAASGRLGLPLLDAGWAIAPGDVLGYASASLPLADNRHLVDDCEILVRPVERGRGVGRALLDVVEAMPGRFGRTHLMGWSIHAPAAADDPDALRAREGVVAVTPDESTRFALDHGWHLAQVERHSILTIAPTGPAPAVPSGYSFVSWRGRTPTERLDAVAELHALFSVEAPTGDLEVEEEAWDADRLARHEDETDAHMDRLTVLAIHDATGDVAGFTSVTRERAKPAGAFQGVTLVRPGHRGHGLGLALKLANLDAVRAAWPDARRIHTWNAGENDAMWRVNEALGFETAGAEALWQKVP